MAPSILICAHEHDRIALMSGHARRLAARIGAGEPETASDADTARRLLDPPHELHLAIIDARLPRDAVTAPDFTGEEALTLAEWIRDNCEKPPVMIVTEQTPAPPEIDAYCVPDNLAIALPLKQLQSFSGVFDAFFDMLQKTPKMTWNTIEISVRGKSATCHLRPPRGAPMQWGVVTADPLKRAAKKYERREKLPEDWVEEMRDDGLELFDTLIKGPLGAGFYAHIERAAGLLKGLAFRFKVEDADLHAAPFEALGRPNESDMDSSPFILLYAPVARQVTSVLVRPSAVERPMPRPARMLFVRSQVANNPAGMVLRDTVGLPVVDPKTNKSHVSFEALRNIDLELKYLAGIHNQLPADELEITPLDLSAPEHTSDAVSALRTELKRHEYDIVHFAGHSKTIGFGPGGNTYLILPGAKVGEAVAFSVENFAECAGESKVRLVYLSSCQGSSARSVASLVRHGVSHVVGFRWDVDDHRAAEFAKAFYTSLFAEPRTVCAAFCSACNNARRLLEKENESPIWASPILIAQTDDWLVRPFTPPPPPAPTLTPPDPPRYPGAMR